MHLRPLGQNLTLAGTVALWGAENGPMGGGGGTLVMQRGLLQHCQESSHFLGISTLRSFPFKILQPMMNPTPAKQKI